MENTNIQDNKTNTIPNPDFPNHKTSNNNTEKYQENNFLKNKTKRKEENTNEENKSQRITLKKQLEFYFQDENLLNDKFLQKFLLRDADKGVPITIIENFNKIKEILKDIKEYNKKIDYIKSAVEASTFIKLNKKQNKIKRIQEFSIEKLNTDEIDERTLYVENLPVNISHTLLTKIFSHYGKVIHVSIPKFSDTKQPKGFGFVIFKSAEESKKAKEELDNKVPKELLNWNNTQPLRQFVIYTKKDWLGKKEEFKKLKLELQNENKDLFSSCFQQSNEDIINVKKGTFIILKNLPDKISRNEIKIWVSHFVEPAYVDLNLPKKECIVRFSHPIYADSFVNKFYNCKETKINNHKIDIIKLEGEDEEKYIKKVDQLKKDFSQNKKNVKKKNK